MSNASTHLTPVHTSANRLFVQYGPNQKGRDFAVGDIHGEFSLLERLLEKAGFNEQTDRLFSVGDLVDRGPESHRVAWWLLKPWFKAVRGNHDQWCVEGGLFEEPIGHRQHGGKWFYALSEELRPFLGGFLNELPVAIEIAGRSGERYGVVHAECTCLSWGRFVEALEGELGDSYRDHHVMEALWRRRRYDDADTRPIAGIGRVYVGHAVVDEVLDLGNVRYLDTGGCFEGGRLTLVEIGGSEAIFSVEKVCDSGKTLLEVQ